MTIRVVLTSIYAANRGEPNRGETRPLEEEAPCESLSPSSHSLIVISVSWDTDAFEHTYGGNRRGE